jgi:signal peptidase II
LAATDHTSAPESDRQVRSGARSFVLLAVGAFLLDRLTKTLIVSTLELGDPVPVLGDLLQLRYVENPGAAFSLGSGTTWIFALVAAGVAIVIVIFARRIRSFAWATVFGLLLGGTLGNLFDRLTRPPSFGQGHVVDFIQLWGFPAIFNLADVAIVASMVLFVVLTLRGVGLDGRRRGTAAPAETSTDPDA